jgi:hypothetical protein
LSCRGWNRLGRKGSSTFAAIDDLRYVLFMGGLMFAEVDFSKRALVDDFVLVDNIALYSFFYHLYLFDLIIIIPSLSFFYKPKPFLYQFTSHFYTNSQ